MRKREKLAGLDDDTPHKKLDKFSPTAGLPQNHTAHTVD